MALIQCADCGGSLSSRAVVCPNCGAPQHTGAAALAAQPPVAGVYAVQQGKNASVAAGLSFLWCGFGQIYNGQVTKGIVLALLYPVAIVLFWVGRTVWLAGAVGGDFNNQP